MQMMTDNVYSHGSRKIFILGSIPIRIIELVDASASGLPCCIHLDNPHAFRTCWYPKNDRMKDLKTFFQVSI